MHYYSTSNHTIRSDFREATLQGQPSDKGLYFPEHIPQLSDNFLRNFKTWSKEAIASEIIQPYVGNTIDRLSLEQIVAETVNFDFPLVSINDKISVLELFHGPTLAFKDVGARFMSRCLGYFAKEEKTKTTVLVATSGDTGGAVAHAFLGVANTEVIILYPSGKVSNIQERQLTTLGQNITALEVRGSFDDCQRMVKEAFADAELNSMLRLTSANSINVARWLPQQFYYFYALQQWPEEVLPVICVPSGNFGNICAGLLAHQSGLPVHHFIAACNANDVVPDYLASGKYESKPARHTLSNAMDVGNPSNFVRVLELFQQEFPLLKKVMSSYSVSDEATVQTMQSVKSQYGYLLDPHGAVGYAALQQYLEQHPQQKGIVLETAHPVKSDTEKIMGSAVPLPGSVRGLLEKEKRSVLIDADVEALKVFLIERGG